VIVPTALFAWMSDRSGWSIAGPDKGEQHADQPGHREFVAYRGQPDHDQPRCRLAGSFDGASYRMRFPVTCIGSPERVRFTAYVQLYNDTADGIIGGEYAPAWDELSPWLDLH
jgi:hypothetical protein